MLVYVASVTIERWVRGQMGKNVKLISWKFLRTAPDAGKKNTKAGQTPILWDRNKLWQRTCKTV
jgi:hypothetical protein